MNAANSVGFRKKGHPTYAPRLQSLSWGTPDKDPQHFLKPLTEILHCMGGFGPRYYGPEYLGYPKRIKILTIPHIDTGWELQDIPPI